ncbi:lipopolysaccharide biosynthesis protein [Chthonobacter rhizosphaerae]|uniref:lipopolysaccharide biosynthesis protein n=1 Tax=Chthonobacter rhizosphaerae TaxID=2735553 RepID=UPI0015EFD5FB|nr:oligosaccharide flippase family protein [Chthonobacter rhizosphaerae]
MATNRKIFINTVAGGATRILGLAIAFVTTPVMIVTLGDQGFGLFTLIGALTAYAGLLDFGIGPGLVRHYSEYTERGEPLAVRQVTTFSIVFYAVLFLVVAGPLYAVAPALCDLLGLPAEMRDTAVASIMLMFGWFILSSLGGVFGSRLVSLHRMDVVSVIALVGQILYAALVILVLPIYPTVTAAILFNVGQVLFTALVMLALVIRADGNPVSNPFRIPGALVKKLLSFGGWMQINQFAAIVSLELDKLIIGRYLGVAAVTPYQIGNRLATLNRLIPLQFLSAIVPAATSIAIRARGPELEAFYVRMNRYLMVMTLAITGFVVADANRLVLAWIGREYAEAVFVIIALSISFAVNNLTGGGTTIVRSAGMPRYETYYALVSTGLNVVLTLAAAPYFGLVGIIGATIVANVIGSVYFLVLFGRLFDFPLWRSLLSWLIPLVAVTVASILAVKGVHAVFPPQADAGRWVHLGWLIIEGSLFMLVFVPGLFVARFCTEEETALASRFLAGFRRTIRI